LTLNIDDDLAVVAVNADILAGEPDLSEGGSDNTFEVNLGAINANLAKQDNLLLCYTIDDLELTIPVLEAVSMATFAFGSIFRQASTMASEI
jgi:hypothetical protein